MNTLMIIDSIDHNECTEEQFHASNNFLNCEITRFKESILHYAKTYMPNVIITSIRKQLLCFMSTNIMLFLHLSGQNEAKQSSGRGVNSSTREGDTI